MRTFLTVSLIICCVLLVEGQRVQRGFEVTIENLSGGSILPSALSEIVWSVHNGANPLFTVGEKATSQLVPLVTGGNGSILVNALSTSATAISYGRVQTSAAALPGFHAAGQIPPGGVVHFGIRGKPGDSFSFVSQFVESNDAFYGLDANGVPLFDSNGNPLSGTYSATLYDAGVLTSEPPGSGYYQPLRQGAPANASAVGVISPQALSDIYPASSTVIRVTITAAVMFKVRLENIGNGTGLSPPAWAVSRSPRTFFTIGGYASAGLKNLAENGVAADLVNEAAAKPGVLFTGVGSNTPIRPGQFTEFVFPGTPGSVLHLAFMYGASNDRFWSFSDSGLSLFQASGALHSDLADRFTLFDAGTARNQAPGTRSGPNTFPTNSTIKNALFGDPDGFTYQSIKSTFNLHFTPIVEAPGYTSSVPQQNVYVSFSFNGMIKP